MEKINVANLLKDCPNGMELDCTMFDNANFIGVENYEKPICIRIGDMYLHLTEFGTWNFDKNAKCVIFPKGKTTWEGFIPPCKFKNGDVLYVDANDKWDNDDRYKFVFIFEELVGQKKEEIYGRKVMAHCYMTGDGYFRPRKVYLIDNKYPIRFATEEEKQKLFNTIKGNGYKWICETKTLEKLVEPKFKVGDRIKEKKSNEDIVLITDITDDYYIVETKYGMEVTISISIQNKYELVPYKFDITTLKPFDKVLVRMANDCVLVPKIFSYYATDPNIKDYPFITTVSISYTQCIPYNK